MSLSHPRTIEDLLNYRLSRLLSSSGALTLKLCEGKYGITRREWRLLGLLATHGAMSPSALAERLNVDRPRISRCISDLVEKGLLRRVPSQDDRRSVRVGLTPGGQRVYRELFPQTVALHERVLHVLTPQEVKVLDKALERLTGSADEMVRTYPIRVKADRRNGGSRRVRRYQPSL